jgi:hypothetical protein
MRRLFTRYGRQYTKRGRINKMEKEEAIQERDKLLEMLESETSESKRYNIERRIGDLNQFVINK